MKYCLNCKKEIENKKKFCSIDCREKARGRRKNGNIICQECNKVLGSTMQGLVRHIKRQHDIELKVYVIKYKYKGNPPFCPCGCGRERSWFQLISDYRQYASLGCVNRMSHKRNTNKDRFEKYSRNMTTEQRIRNSIKSAETKRKKGTLKRTKEEKEKISTGLKEAYKTKKRIPWPYLRENSDVIYQEIARKREETIKKNIESGKKYYNWTRFDTKPEKLFEQFLKEKNLNYKKKFKIKGSSHPYDFYVSDYNLIVEIYGDFWHCGPAEHRFKNDDDIHPVSRKTTKEIKQKDEKNKEYAIKHGFKFYSVFQSELDNINLNRRWIWPF